MEVHDFFLQLLLVLLSARICGELASLLNAPSVIGELSAGVILGPSLLGWLQPNEIIRLLAEVGIILLLFDVGLETDLRRLVDAGSKALVVALGGIIGPFVLGFAVCYWLFSLSLLISLFIGGTLTATSIGITMRVFTDIGMQHSRVGQIVLGAAVLDDIIGVILLALLYEFSVAGGVSMENAGKVALFIGAFFIIAPVLAKVMSVVIRYFDRISETPGMIPTTLVSLVLFFAWLAHVIGAPEILGGFAAGLALSRRFFLPFGVAMSADSDFSKRVSGQMKPIVQLFSPIFFVMVGLSLDLSNVQWGETFIWYFSLALGFVAIVGKFVGVFLIRESWPSAVLTGMAMVPRGEVGLIFAELGRVTGVFPNYIYAGLILVIAYTTVLSPFWIKLFYRYYRDRLELEH